MTYLPLDIGNAIDTALDQITEDAAVGPTISEDTISDAPEKTATGTYGWVVILPIVALGAATMLRR